MLVLAASFLVKLVWDLKVVAGQKQVQMESIPARSQVVDPVEQSRAVAAAVKDRELRSIQEPARPLKVESREVSPVLPSYTKPGILLNGAKGPVRGVKTSSWSIQGQA